MKKAFLIAPSRFCTEDQIKWAIENLSYFGWKPKFLENITDRYFYFAGTKERRINEINTALNDPETDTIFCVSGGMGAIHLLDSINFRTNIKKDFVGFSDITILLNTLKKNKKIRCLHGPTLGKKPENIDKFSKKILYKALNKKDYKIQIKERDILVKGFSQAKIVGGNLSLLAKTLGTPYEIKTDNRILFLEQNAYTGRMILDLLWQLKLSRKFEKIKGIILGQFTNSDEEVKEYLRYFFKEFRIPIIINQEIGHNATNITIPLDEKCIINTEKKYWKIIFKQKKKRKFNISKNYSSFFKSIYPFKQN